MTEKVFFLGAGFSKAISAEYPLMKELTQQVLTELRRESLQKHLSEIPPQVKQDIESLLTYLSTDFPWKKDTEKYANLALYTNIVEILSSIFVRHTPQEFSYAKLPEIGKKFAQGILWDSRSYNFITLNYDILLEQLLLCVRKQQNPKEFISYQDFYPYPVEWIGYRNTQGGSFWGGEKKLYPPIPQILKLHGSANWFWAGISPSDILYYRNWNRNEEAIMNKGLKPYIIPPVLDKNALYNHIAIHSLWRDAEDLIRIAEEVYIIGFSFPQTDLAVKYLFQSALRKYRPHIYVINTASEQKLSQNYSKVFGNIKLDYTYTGTEDALERFIREHLLKGTMYETEEE